MVRADLHKAAANGDKRVFLALSMDDKLAPGQGRHQGGVMRQDPQLPLNARGHDHTYIIFKDRTLGGHNLAA
jgi:hypothetical protein